MPLLSAGVLSTLPVGRSGTLFFACNGGASQRRAEVVGTTTENASLSAFETVFQQTLRHRESGWRQAAYCLRAVLGFGTHLQSSPSQVRSSPAQQTQKGTGFTQVSPSAVQATHIKNRKSQACPVVQQWLPQH